VSEAEYQSFIILGVTSTGEKFRPSDWADRLSGTLASIGSTKKFGATKKVRYSPYVSPGDYNGDKAVFVDGDLSRISPEAYEYLHSFARKNDLRVISGVCSLDERP
jgi:hypothetical protein